jgi:hypothetical protein
MFLVIFIFKFIYLYKDNQETLKECVIKGISQDEVVVEWVDSTGKKFGKILSIDRIFTIQQQTQKYWIKFVPSFVMSICFFACFLIFTLSVSERYETLKEVCFINK